MLIAIIVLAIFLVILLYQYLKQSQRFKKYKPIINVEEELVKLSSQKAQADKDYNHLKQELERLTREVDGLQNEFDVQDHGLYTPVYDFDSSEQYKQRLDQVREKQKEMVKNKEAVLWEAEWVVGNSRAKGKAMENQFTRLMLRAFNGECDALISSVKYDNIVKIDERMTKLFEGVNNLGKSNKCEINPEYLQLKLDELRLVHEYKEKKQEELEEQRRIREEMKEEERAQKEIQNAILEAEKEETRYQKALEKATEQVQKATGEKQEKLNSEIERLQQLLAEAHSNSERAKSRAQMTKSGYVYIISNIGSFGEHVYKIGMTRRLNPEDRINELGDASVPFRFDIHGMIFSNDAPGLENQLHKVFESKRVNQVNLRKEFFRVSLSEIETAAKNLNLSVQFTKLAEAQEYRQSLQIIKNNPSSQVSVVVEPSQEQTKVINVELNPSTDQTKVKKPVTIEQQTAWYKHQIRKIVSDNPQIKSEINLAQFRPANDPKALDYKRLYAHVAKLNRDSQDPSLKA